MQLFSPDGASAVVDLSWFTRAQLPLQYLPLPSALGRSRALNWESGNLSSALALALCASV